MTAAPARTNVIAVVIALATALLLRAWLQGALENAGVDHLLAADLAYLLVPLVLAVLLFPVLRQNWRFVRDQLQCQRVSIQLIFAAIAIGVLIRIAWWAQLTASVSFGLLHNSDPDVVRGPQFSYQCGLPGRMVLGIVVASVLTPLIEEVIHRGYVQSVLHKYGPVIAVAASTVVFTLFHHHSGWPIALAGGIVLGTMYWLSGSLWPSILTHAVVNLTPHFTWRCMNLQWNPARDSLPLWFPGIPAAVLFGISVGAIAWLVLVKCRRRNC